MSTEGSGKKRVLLLVDENMWPILSKVLEGYRSIRVVELDAQEYPAPAGKRLVSDAAWEVLRQGARIPITTIEESLEALGTRWLSNDQRINSEKWCVSELARRSIEDEDFDE